MAKESNHPKQLCKRTDKEPAKALASFEFVDSESTNNEDQSYLEDPIFYIVGGRGFQNLLKVP